MTQSIDVLLLAAGFGTRLRPLTDSMPKPLLEVGKGALIDCALWHLRRAGLNVVTINTHYLGEQIETYLGNGSSRGMSITYSRENPILDTGGALKRVMGPSPKRNLLIFNADSVFGTELDVPSFVHEFDSLGSFAHLMVIETAADRPFAPIKAVKTDRCLKVLQFPGSKGIEQDKGAPAGGEYIFTGLSILSRSASRYWDEFGDVFSSTRDLYPRALADNQLISGQLFSGFWRDTGEKARLAEVRDAVIVGKVGTF